MLWNLMVARTDFNLEESGFHWLALSQILSGFDWPILGRILYASSHLLPPASGGLFPVLPFFPEDAGDMFLHNVGFSLNYKTLQPRRSYSS
jgi:hypothetical protein